MTGRSRAASLAVGVATALAGVALTLKPFSSLDALTLFIGVSLVLAGLGDGLAARRDGELPTGLVPGVLLALGGLLALVLPALTVRAVAVVVGVGLVLSGVARVAIAVRGVATERLAKVVGGAASVVFGILALAWPDLSILGVALLVGPVAIVLGLAQVMRAWHPAGDADRVAAPGHVRHRLGGRWSAATGHHPSWMSSPATLLIWGMLIVRPVH